MMFGVRYPGVTNIDTPWITLPFTGSTTSVHVAREASFAPEPTTTVLGETLHREDTSKDACMGWPGAPKAVWRG